jgi:hypothetical protein
MVGTVAHTLLSDLQQPVCKRRQRQMLIELVFELKLNAAEHFQVTICDHSRLVLHNEARIEWVKGTNKDRCKVQRLDIVSHLLGLHSVVEHWSHSLQRSARWNNVLQIRKLMGMTNIGEVIQGGVSSEHCTELLH